MASLTPARRAFYERRAAARGQTLEQFLADCEAEATSLDRMRDLMYDRWTQWSVIGDHALANMRAFVRLA